jgi:hypothetical protein
VSVPFSSTTKSRKVNTLSRLAVVTLTLNELPDTTDTTGDVGMVLMSPERGLYGP